MNKITQNNAVHPQTVEIPQPLEAHPSVSESLANGLLAAVEKFHREPRVFDMGAGVGAMERGQSERFCVICWAHKLTGFDYSGYNLWETPSPLGHPARIYDVDQWPCKTDSQCISKTIARIEHFLRTGA